MNEENQYVKINKHIDVLPYFGNWEVSSIVVFIVVFSVFIMISNKFFMQCVGISAGILAMNLHIKLKENAVKGFTRHIAYRLGIMKTKHLIPSHVRVFKGA